MKNRTTDELKKATGGTVEDFREVLGRDLRSFAARVEQGGRSLVAPREPPRITISESKLDIRGVATTRAESAPGNNTAAGADQLPFADIYFLENGGVQLGRFTMTRI